MSNCKAEAKQAEIVGSTSVAAGKAFVAVDDGEMIFVGVVPSDSGMPEGIMIDATAAARIATWLWAAAAARRARSTA